MLVVSLGFLLPLRAKAKDLDEIQLYIITVKVNEDATLDMNYHIKWKVLDDTEEGPLEWVKIGIPNKHCSNIEAKSDCIKKIAYSGVGGSYIRIDLDRKYKAGEIVTLDFSFTQDYMYQMNAEKEGETVYQFTPGWFDEIKVDCLEIMWSNDRILSATPEYTEHPTFYSWETSLKKKERYTIKITYPNDAFAFDTSKKIKKSSYVNTDWLASFLCVGFLLLIPVLIGLDYLKCYAKWKRSSGFKGTRKKITRTVIEYFGKCPNCGALRVEGKNACPYCSTNLIKKKTKITEERIPKKFKDCKDEIIKQKRTGTYPLSSTPDTYVQVTSVSVPHRTSFSSFYLSNSGSRGGHG